MKLSIGAGIVTFNPDIDKLKSTLMLLSPQVDCVYIADNASENYSDIADMIAALSSEGSSVKLMLGELLVTRHDKMHYTLHFFAPEDDPESLSELETVLRSIEFQ